MRKLRWPYLWLVLALVLSLGLAACGGDDDENGDDNDDTESTPIATDMPDATEGADTAATEGNVENGQALFTSVGCAGCHAVDSEDTLVGPGLQNISDRAGERVEGMSAEDYLRTSIVEPDAHVVEGFNEGQMPAFANLSEQELSDLVAYMMSL